MGGVERRGHGRDDALHAVEGEFALVDQLAQVRARDEAHRQIEDAAILAGLVDRHDVGCSSDAASRASALKRRTASGFCVCSGAMILSATVRLSSSSVAR